MPNKKVEIKHLGELDDVCPLSKQNIDYIITSEGKKEIITYDCTDKKEPCGVMDFMHYSNCLRYQKKEREV